MDPIAIGLGASNWLWEKFGADVKDVGVGVAKKAWSKMSWKDREESYKKRLIQLYSTTKLLGNPKEIKLDRIYTDVYVLDKISAYRRLSIDERTNNLKEYNGLPASVTREPLIDIVQTKQRIYVLGKPGAGKSTFLKMVCLQCCNGKIQKTPIILPLKQWNDSGLDLIAFIVKEFDICQFPSAEEFVNKLLSNGSAILLLDGLDEVPVEKDCRAKTIATLSEFARKYSSTQIILTCRIAATEYSFDQFDYYEIADFTADQQNQFIENWYAGEDVVHKAFTKQWCTLENQGLRDLAQTPLLLALLCLAFDETMSFPKRRVELYQEATNALLRKWDSSRGIRRDELYRNLSHIRKEQLLAKLAATTFFNGKVFFEKKLVTKIIEEYVARLPPRDEARESDGEDVLRAIEAQHGLLIERAMGIYSFSHLTIQEYFTARHLVENTHAGIMDEKIKKHLFEDRWREVFLLAASSLDDADPFFCSVSELFEEKFFKSAEIIELFKTAQTATKQVPFAEQSSKVWGQRAAYPNTPSYNDYAKILDLSLSLASNFHYLKCGERASWRVRRLISYLESLPPTTDSIFQPGSKATDLLIKYLRATNVVIESLQVASLSNRESIIDKLICPVPEMPFMTR